MGQYVPTKGVFYKMASLTKLYKWGALTPIGQLARSNFKATIFPVGCLSIELFSFEWFCVLWLINKISCYGDELVTGLVNLSPRPGLVQCLRRVLNLLLPHYVHLSEDKQELGRDRL